MKLIYFIGDGRGHIKIGISDNPASRLDALQTGSPVRLTLLCSYPGTEEDERRLHGEFEHDRVVGEWFRDASNSAGSFVEFLRWWVDRMRDPDLGRFPAATWDDLIEEWEASYTAHAVYRGVLHDPVEWATAAQVGR